MCILCFIYRFSEVFIKTILIIAHWLLSPVIGEDHVKF